MKFRVNTSKEAVEETSGSSYISKSGIYDVEIAFASLDVSKNGAESVNFNLNYNGNSQTIYGPYVTNKDGNVNEIGAKLINKLAIVSGMGDGDEFEIEEETHKVGKDNKPQEFAVITNFSELPIKIRLQEEYSMWDGKIKKTMRIKNFFRAEDNASAEEIIDGDNSKFGTRYTLEEEKYADNVTYKDGLTSEDVEEWKKAMAEAAKGGSTTPKPKTTKAPTTKKAGGLFK
jgi:hypothetical protein